MKKRTTLTMPKMSAPPKPPSDGDFKYRSSCSKGVMDLFLYGPIGRDFWGDGGMIEAKRVITDISKAGKLSEINVRLNSPGGDTFEAFAIYNYLLRHEATIHTFVDGEALSAASLLLQAGATRTVAESSMVMIHNPWTVMAGDARALRAAADMLEKNQAQLVQLYADRGGIEAKQVQKWMNDESWFTGPEALEAGLADDMIENLKIAACPFDPKTFSNVPKWVLERLGNNDAHYLMEHQRQAVIAQRLPQRV